MAHTVGVSKSQLSREFVEESEKKLKKLCERRFDDKDIIAVYVDGIQYGDCHVIVALGVDSEGHKHVLGIREGSSENSRVASDLLVDMVERGIRADRLRLFVIDGSKALRCAIDAVYGPDNPVQRCLMMRLSLRYYMGPAAIRRSRFPRRGFYNYSPALKA